MATAPTLICKRRDLGTGGYLNKMKREGWVPGVIYGKQSDSQSIWLDAKEVRKVFSHTGTRGVFMLQVDDSPAPIMALIREIQRTPINHDYVHIDFLPLKSDEKVNNTVSIRIIGEDQLIAKGLVLQVMTNQFEISCLPADIPEIVSIDVSLMDIGDKVTMADLNLPANVELLEDPITMICSVMLPARAAEEVAPAVEEEVQP